MTPNLWQHQQNAIARAKNKFALFFDPGCGKSRTALELFNASEHITAIIFAPLNVCRNWQNEIKLYSKVKDSVVVAGQSRGKKLRLLEEFSLHPEFKILIVNIECLRSREYLQFLTTLKFRFVIVDESHNCKSPNSLQTKGLLEFLRIQNPEHVYLLTGTPAPQGEIDLWSTFYILGKTELPFYVWRKKYFVDLNEHRKHKDNYFPRYVVREQSKTEFQRLLSECSAVAKKDLVLDLPPLIRTDVFCELSAEQRKHYETMLQFLFAVDETGERLSAKNVLSRTLRLQQIVAGYLSLDDGLKELKSNRLDALKYAVEQTAGEQFIVWTIFTDTYAQVAAQLDKMGISYGFLTGAQNADERYATMTAFQAGKLRALIAHPKAGGVGVNLTAASYSIHYTKNFNLVDDLQSEARNYRAGSEQHARITRIDIVAQDTIDEKINEALATKKTIQDFILSLDMEAHG